MKYLKDKKSRRRGIAIELAVMLMLVMVASSTIIITTTMIQVNKQKESFSDLTELVNDIEKIEYDQIGKAFINTVCVEIESTHKYDLTEENILTEESNIKSLLDLKYYSLKSQREIIFNVDITMPVEEVHEIVDPEDVIDDNSSPMPMIESYQEGPDYVIIDSDQNDETIQYKFKITSISKTLDKIVTSIKTKKYVQTYKLDICDSESNQVLYSMEIERATWETTTTVTQTYTRTKTETTVVRTYIGENSVGDDIIYTEETEGFENPIVSLETIEDKQETYSINSKLVDYKIINVEFKVNNEQ